MKKNIIFLRFSTWKLLGAPPKISYVGLRPPRSAFEGGGEHLTFVLRAHWANICHDKLSPFPWLNLPCLFLNSLLSLFSSLYTLFYSQDKFSLSPFLFLNCFPFSCLISHYFSSPFPSYHRSIHFHSALYLYLPKMFPFSLGFLLPLSLPYFPYIYLKCFPFPSDFCPFLNVFPLLDLFFPNLMYLTFYIFFKFLSFS